MSLAASQLLQSCSLLFFWDTQSAESLVRPVLYLGQLELKMHCLLTISLNIFPSHGQLLQSQNKCTWFVFLWAQCNRIPLIKWGWPLPHGGEVKRGWHNSSATAQPDPVKCERFLGKRSRLFECEVCKNTTVAKQSCSCFYKLGLREVSSVREVLFFVIALITQIALRNIKITVWIILL